MSAKRDEAAERNEDFALSVGAACGYVMGAKDFHASAKQCVAGALGIFVCMLLVCWLRRVAWFLFERISERAS